MRFLNVGQSGEIATLEEVTDPTIWQRNPIIEAVSPELVAFKSNLALVVDDGIELIPGEAITSSDRRALLSGPITYLGFA